VPRPAVPPPPTVRPPPVRPLPVRPPAAPLPPQARAPRASALGLLAGLAALVGCADAPAPPPKITVVTGHAAPAAGGFGAGASPCCSDPAAKAVVMAFIDLGAALAADDAPGAPARAAALAAAIAAAPPEAAAGPGAPAWSALQSVGPRLAQAEGVAALRAAYLEASGPAIELARAHPGGDTPLAVAYCPMKPGRWLQAAEPLANPYYGAEMLRCGVFEKL
jgi:hypothetical protein